MRKLYLLLLLIGCFQLTYSQNLTFTNTGNARLAPYGEKSWNWDTARYKHFYYKSQVDNYVMPYRLLSPPNIDQTKKYPLFIMFHGAGEGVGGNCDKVTNANTCQLIWGGKLSLDSINKYPSYVFFPQTGGGYWGNNGSGNSFYGYSDPMASPTRVVFEIIDNILLQNYNIDPDRIYINGLSAGGRAVWEFLERRPDLFAAATPISGMGNVNLAKTLINNPIWNFQGGMDTNPGPFETQNMYDSLVKYGGLPKRSLYVDRDHWAWVDAYNSNNWLQWVYKQDKKIIHTLYGKSTSICPGDSVTIGISYGYNSYQWKKDGLDIIAANNYTYSAKTPGIYTVAAQRKDNSVMISHPLVVTSKNCEVTAQNGVNYSYYEGTFTNLPDFNSLVPKKSGKVNNYSLVPRETELNYAFKFEGFINITTPGEYTFFTNSDDGSKLYIDGIQVVNNDFAQGATERSGKINLTVGKKAISVTYFQSTGGQLLEVYYVGPGLLKQLIPDYALFYNSGVNQAPSALAGADIVLTLPTNSVSIIGQGIDNDGTITSFQWSKISGPSATISGVNSATLSLSNLLAGSYVFRLSVTDNGGLTNTDDVTITVKANPNLSPIANAGNDIVVNLPVSTTNISGSGSDSDGSIISYLWTIQSGPAAVLTNSTSAVITVSGLTAGVYTLRLTVKDNLGATGFDDVLITVNPANVAGLKYSYYEGSYNLLPNFNNLTPVKTGTIPNYSLTPRNRDLQYAFKYDGFINITTSGSYTFYTRSNDGSKLYINGVQIVNNDYLQAATERSGTVNLTAGKLPITVTYFQQGGGAILEVRYLGPGIAKQLIPNNVLYSSVAPNVPPVVNAGADKIITLPTSTTTLMGSVSDQDGTIVSNNWTKVAGPSVTLTNATTLSATISNLTEGIYTFRLTTKDNSNATSFDDVTITVKKANLNPIASAGEDVNITLPESTTTLVGVGNDADGTIVSYLWTKISGPVATLTNANSNNLLLSNLIEGSYVFRLTVTDNNGGTAIDDVTVSVSGIPNINPVAFAGKDTIISVRLKELSISGSATDADGLINSYFWSRISGPDAHLSGINTANLIVSNLLKGTYVFRLLITDDKGGNSFDDITAVVEVNGNIAPNVFAGNDTILVVPVNSFERIGKSIDADGNIASMKWNQLSGPATNFVDNANGRLLLNEIIAGKYIFNFTVVDSMDAKASDEFTLTILPANQLPVANAGLDVTLTLPNNQTTLSGNGTDTDGTIKSYTWTKIAGPAVILGNTNSPNLPISGLVEGTYNFLLSVSDDKNGVGTDEVLLTVLPALNKIPVAMAGTDAVITLPSNSINLVGSGIDSDGIITTYLWSKISGPTAIIESANTTTTLVSGMSAGTYVFRLTITDNVGATAVDEVIVSVNAAASTCNFGTPLKTALPNANFTYSKAYVLGQGGPNLSNVKDFSINWNLTQKGLYALSMHTSNGVPSWYLDLRTMSTNTFSSVAPTITLSKTGILNLDGIYNVGLSNGNFVMAEKSGKFTIYFTNSPVAPNCASARIAENDHTFELNISPNPANHIVKISTNSGSIHDHFSFINEYGHATKLHGIYNHGSWEFDVSILEPGVYTVLLQREGHQEVRKLVVIR